jgi:hypothetical protein
MDDKPLNIFLGPDGILVIQFPNLGRRAFDEYRAYLEKFRDRLQAGILLLHDLRQAGYPSVASLGFYEGVFDEFEFPKMFLAILIAPQMSPQVYESLKRRMRPEVVEVRIFIEEAAALGWLLSFKPPED